MVHHALLNFETGLQNSGGTNGSVYLTAGLNKLLMKNL
jgi:hypothetical protein